MNSICINCGSNIGLGDIYKNEAISVGKYCATNNITIVFGGANVGLMGEIANAALDAGGKVIGVIPLSIADKVGHKGLTQLIITESMHDRKAKMFELSDGFIAFPGGFGTLEEIFELLTWAQLGFHKKPCGFLNVNNYYNKLFEFIDHAVECKFIKNEFSEMIIRENSMDKIIDKFKHYKAPIIEKWIK
jgi:uncharacterized protein (TIGR00730 family)